MSNLKQNLWRRHMFVELNSRLERRKNKGCERKNLEPVSPSQRCCESVTCIIHMIIPALPRLTDNTVILSSLFVVMTSSSLVTHAPAAHRLSFIITPRHGDAWMCVCVQYGDSTYGVPAVWGSENTGRRCRQTDGERERRKDLGRDKDLTFILSLWTGLTATRQLTGGEGADKDGGNKRERWRRTEIEKEERDNKKGIRALGGGQKTPKHKC